MKRKISLLLAVAMLVSVIAPMNLFAATNTYSTGTGVGNDLVVNHGTGTIIVAGGLEGAGDVAMNLNPGAPFAPGLPGYWASPLGGTPYPNALTGGTAVVAGAPAVANNAATIANWPGNDGRGTGLLMQFGNGTTMGPNTNQYFDLTLSGAQFYYARTTNEIFDNTSFGGGQTGTTFGSFLVPTGSAGTSTAPTGTSTRPTQWTTDGTATGSALFSHNSNAGFIANLATTSQANFGVVSNPGGSGSGYAFQAGAAQSGTANDVLGIVRAALDEVNTLLKTELAKTIPTSGMTGPQIGRLYVIDTTTLDNVRLALFGRDGAGSAINVAHGGGTTDFGFGPVAFLRSGFAAWDIVDRIWPTNALVSNAQREMEVSAITEAVEQLWVKSVEDWALAYYNTGTGLYTYGAPHLALTTPGTTNTFDGTTRLIPTKSNKGIVTTPNETSDTQGTPVPGLPIPEALGTTDANGTAKAVNLFPTAGLAATVASSPSSALGYVAGDGGSYTIPSALWDAVMNLPSDPSGEVVTNPLRAAMTAILNETGWDGGGTVSGRNDANSALTAGTFGTSLPAANSDAKSIIDAMLTEFGLSWNNGTGDVTITIVPWVSGTTDGTVTVARTGATSKVYTAANGSPLDVSNLSTLNDGLNLIYALNKMAIGYNKFAEHGTPNDAGTGAAWVDPSTVSSGASIGTIGDSRAELPAFFTNALSSFNVAFPDTTAGTTALFTYVQANMNNVYRNTLFEVSAGQTTDLGSYEYFVGQAAKRMSGRNDAKAIPYTAQINADRNVMRITVDRSFMGGENINPGDLLYIPLAIVSTGTGAITWTVTAGPGQTSNLFTAQTGTLTGASRNLTSRGYGTDITVTGTNRTARGRIAINAIDITERGLNIIKNGSFVMVAPPGYTFTPTTSGTLSSSFISNISYELRTFPVLDSNGNQTRVGALVTFPGTSFAATRQTLITVRMSGLELVPLDSNPETMSNIGESLTIDFMPLADVDLDGNALTGGFLNPATGNYGRAVGAAIHANQQLPNIKPIGGFVARNAYTTVAGWINDATSRTAPPATTPASGQAGVSAQSVSVGTRESWNMTFSSNNTQKDVYSGRINQEAGTATLTEQVIDSWFSEQDTVFTLTDADGTPLTDVKITKVQVWGTNLNRGGTGSANIGSSSAPVTFWNRDNTVRDSDTDATALGLYGPVRMSNTSAYFTTAGNAFGMTDLRKPNSARDSLRTLNVKFYLSANVNWEGTVYVSVSGPGLGNNDYTALSQDRVPIATFKSPISVETSSSALQIGFQKYSVSPVTIMENYDAVRGPGLVSGRNLQIALGEYGFGLRTPYMYFAPISKSDVRVDAGTGNSFNISDVSFNYGRRVIDIMIVRGSRNSGATIYISGLALNTDRTVPEGWYDLLIGGQAVLDNGVINDNSNVGTIGSTVAAGTSTDYTFLYDRFNNWGFVSKDYVQMATEGANKTTKNVVEIPFAGGTRIVTVNGVETEIEAPVLNIDGRLYLPARFIANIIGIPNDNIFYNDDTQQATFLTPERTVVFQKDSNQFWVNGAQLKMFDDGVEAMAVIANDRIYVPVKYFAQAFNVPLDPDSSRGIATLNWTNPVQ